MNNRLFRNTLHDARLPSLTQDVPNHWLEEKSSVQKDVFHVQKYRDPKLGACLAKIRALLGEYTFSEGCIIKEIINADYNIELAIHYLLGERTIIKNRGKRKMPTEQTENGFCFVRDDLSELPNEKVLKQIYDNSLIHIRNNIIHPLNDCASHVQDYVQQNIKYYQSVGYGVRQKKVNEKIIKDNKLNNINVIQKKNEKVTNRSNKDMKSKVEQIRNNIETLKIEQKDNRLSTIDIKKKYNKVLNETEIKALYSCSFQSNVPMLNIVICGELNSGKSTLVGKLLSLHGKITNQQMHRFEFDSRQAGHPKSLYAWMTDQRTDERDNLMTIQTGFSYIETKSRYITLMDTPGHKDFAKSTFDAICQADYAILVVSIKKKKNCDYYKFNQTTEQSMILRTIGVKHIIIVVNKVDLLNSGQLSAYEEIKQILTDNFINSGYVSSQISFIPCCAFDGENIKTRSSKLIWYRGGSLVDILDKLEMPSRDIHGNFRMSINDVIIDPQIGASVSGLVHSGYARRDDDLLVEPIHEFFKFKNAHINDDSVETIFGGDIVTIEVSKECKSLFDRLSVGTLLTTIDNSIRCVQKFEARLLMLRTGCVPIVWGSTVTIHSNHLNCPAVVTKIQSITDPKNTVIMERPRRLIANQIGVAHFEVESPILLERYNLCREYGRFIVRIALHTVAVAMVNQLF